MKPRDPSSSAPDLTPPPPPRRPISGIIPLGDFQQKLRQLHERRGSLPPPPSGQASGEHLAALAQLEEVCEELRVADEELRVQQEQILEGQHQLAHEQQRYRDLFDLAPEPYLVTDRSGKILQANEAAEALLDPSRPPLEGRLLTSLVSLRDRGGLRTRMSRQGPGQPVERWECALATLPPRTVAVALRSSGGGRLLWALRDVTEQRRHEAQLRSMNEELERRVLARTEELEASRAVAEKLFVHERQSRKRLEDEGSAREELVALVSHELRNPLQAVLAWAQFSQESEDPVELRQSLGVIERNARTMAMLVDDLIERASLLRDQRPLTVRALGLGELLGRVCRSVEPLRRQAGVELRLSPPAGEVEVHGDAARLEQVFLNLLANALKFTPPAGAIRVTLAPEQGHAVVRVSDSGPGIAPERLALIFDHSHNDDRAARPGSRGLGLGLTVVRHLVEAHGGAVEAQSAGPGHGTTIVVRLPLASHDRRALPQA